MPTHNASQRPFRPTRVQRCGVEKQTDTGLGDETDGRVYVYHHEKLALAVNVALATGRPLLLTGPSGCGKSSVARNVALTLGWRCYEHVITGSTEREDLLYRFDNVRRLNDAQAHQLKSAAAYLEPGVLWWAFDRESASQRGDPNLPPELRPRDSSPTGDPLHAVVLVDEIDKADTDLPNGLLVALGSLRFAVEPAGLTVQAAAPPLIIITNNGERELPLPFLRRCVVLNLPPPTASQLIEIACAMISEDPALGGMFARVAEHVVRHGDRGREIEFPPSTAEYLDTVRACIRLSIDPGSAEFQDLAQVTLAKRQRLSQADT